LRPRLLLAAGLLALCASPAAAAGRHALNAAEAFRLMTALSWLALAAFFAGVLLGWHIGGRGWIWGMRLAAAFEVVLAFLIPAHWEMIRPCLPFLVAGAAAMLAAGALGGWLGSRAGGAT